MPQSDIECLISHLPIDLLRLIDYRLNNCLFPVRNFLSEKTVKV